MDFRASAAKGRIYGITEGPPRHMPGVAWQAALTGGNTSPSERVSSALASLLLGYPEDR